MANKKVSEMTAASALTAAELLHVVQGGADRKATVQQILDAVSGLGSTLSSSLSAPVQKSNDNSPAIESDLALTMEAGTYFVVCGLVATWGAGGLRANFGAGTATLSGNVWMVSQETRDSSAATVTSVDAATAEPSFLLTSTSPDGLQGFGIARVVVSSAGTFGVKWSQRVSNPAATEISSGWIAALGILS